MGQRERILTQILGCEGWRVAEAWFEAEDGRRLQLVGNYLPPRQTQLVLRVERRWSPRCSRCGRLCSRRHGVEERRRWHDLPWAGHPVCLEYAALRVRCRFCQASPLERLPWADPFQRETRRLQHHLAVQTASMPVTRVAAQFRLSWSTVRRAEELAIARWERLRPVTPLRMAGIDEKYLGRRQRSVHKFVTIVSNLETGEPVWMGYGRDDATVCEWLKTLSPAQRAQIRLVAMDMSLAYRSAIGRELPHADIVHDPFHVMKKANEAVDELRRSVFFRADAEGRAVGRGKRWLFLRAWERCTQRQQADLKALLACNAKLANAYQIKEELREVLRAPHEAAMHEGLCHIIRRTQRKSNRPLRRLHHCLRRHWDAILALARHRPPVGRIEALNNNWETLVRIGRGYRDHRHLFRKLRFVTVNPLQTTMGVRQFLDLADLHPALARAA